MVNQGSLWPNLSLNLLGVLWYHTFTKNRQGSYYIMSVHNQDSKCFLCNLKGIFVFFGHWKNRKVWLPKDSFPYLLKILIQVDICGVDIF